MVHAGRVFCVPPASGDLDLAVHTKSSYNRQGGQELALFISHSYPCALSVAVLNEQDEIVRRICHRSSTRPSQTNPEGSLFYWNGTDKNGNPVPPGTYWIQASGSMNSQTFTAFSEPILVE